MLDSIGDLAMACQRLNHKRASRGDGAPNKVMDHRTDHRGVRDVAGRRECLQGCVAWKERSAVHRRGWLRYVPLDLSEPSAYGRPGLTGGWIIQQLLWRGEDSRAIRILDRVRPTRPEAQELAFIETDVRDTDSVLSAFKAPWPERIRELPLTVIHTASFMSFTIRHERLLPAVLDVNVEGVRRVMEASKAAGCDCFISTSSGAVAVKCPQYFVPLWQQHPTNIFQYRPNGEPDDYTASLDTYTGSYGYSKARMELMVHAANAPGFRTGCIRPCHTVYGHGVESTSSASWDHLTRRTNPTYVRSPMRAFADSDRWIGEFATNYTHAMNVALGHLYLEEAILKRPDVVGARSYSIADETIRYGDFCNALSVLAKGPKPVTYPRVPPLPLLLLAYIIETYSLLRLRGSLANLLPPISGSVGLLQPATMQICTGHFIFDSEVAKKDLGYRPAMGALHAIAVTVKDWNENHAAKDKFWQDRRFD
jgi:nucleoside-diphosphate-sugar epimerase